MTKVAAIQFTQEQSRMLTGVSAETVRHWRKAIPYLSTKTGKAARFSFADLVGLAVTYELVKSFGVHIATVSAGVDSLFELLTNSANSLDSAVVFISPTEAILRETNVDGLCKVPSKSALAIPLAPFVAEIQQHMLPTTSVSRQAVLAFSLEAVRSKA